ncbi:MAG TPA: hypothetical protein VFD01_18855 [Candidatus Dormibacteraeota bacterium]|nr:hypothetical protein [Candidatus Dormibacteraeota bacterium]
MRAQGTPAEPAEKNADPATGGDAVRRLLPRGRRDGPPAATGPPLVAVAGMFDDEIRAEQSAAALQVWARANRKLGVGPVAVVARKRSGATSYRPQSLTTPRRGALRGLLTGLVLFALPAAGAAGLAMWALGSVVFGLFGLIGVVPSGQVGSLTLTATVVGAALAALLSGAVGALIGCLVGLLWGLVDVNLHGLGRTEVSRTLALLPPGSAATIVQTASPSAPLVTEELARLGGVEVAESATPGVETPATTTERTT